VIKIIACRTFGFRNADNRQLRTRVRHHAANPRTPLHRSTLRTRFTSVLTLAPSVLPEAFVRIRHCFRCPARRGLTSSWSQDGCRSCSRCLGRVLVGGVDGESGAGGPRRWDRHLS
jgi:hypothetical protein